MKGVGLCLVALLATEALRLPMPGVRLPAVRLAAPRVRAVAVARLPRRAKRKAVVNISTRLACLFCAGFELAEELGELGHHHGLGVLCVSRLAKDVNEGLESVEGLEASLRTGGLRQRVLRAITSRRATRTVAIFALFAAGREVLADLSPGGHHGLFLLAFNELVETVEAAKLGFGAVLESNAVRFGVPLLAMAAAAKEVFDDAARKLGGHHGVLILAVGQLIKVLGTVTKRTLELAGDDARSTAEAPLPPLDKWSWSGPVFGES